MSFLIIVKFLKTTAVEKKHTSHSKGTILSCPYKHLPTARGFVELLSNPLPLCLLPQHYAEQQE
jgi:hypothetical protein